MGTSSTWRVAMYENDNGTLNPVPAAKPDNTFYLDFGTSGQLLGTTDFFERRRRYRRCLPVFFQRGQRWHPGGRRLYPWHRHHHQQPDRRRAARPTPARAAPRPSETSQAITLPAGALSAVTNDGYSITIGSTTYNALASNGDTTAILAAQDLANQINTDTSSDTNYYAVVNTTGANPTLQIFATGGSTYSVTTSALGAATAPTTANGGGASTFSMGDVINAINGAGTAAQGVVSMTSETTPAAR